MNLEFMWKYLSSSKTKFSLQSFSSKGSEANFSPKNSPCSDDIIFFFKRSKVKIVIFHS